MLVADSYAWGLVFDLIFKLSPHLSQYLGAWVEDDFSRDGFHLYLLCAKCISRLGSLQFKLQTLMRAKLCLQILTTFYYYYYYCHEHYHYYSPPGVTHKMVSFLLPLLAGNFFCQFTLWLSLLRLQALFFKEFLVT